MLADALYRLLLLALPRDIRRESGDDMVQLFRDYRREAGRRPLRLASLWIAAARDVFAQAAASRRAGRQAPGPAPESGTAFRMRALPSDLRHGFRLLRRYPATSLLAVATLALGIGVNTAIFSIVDAVLLRQLPYEAPDRLAMVFESRPAEGVMDGVVSVADFVDWRQMNDVFERVAAHVDTTMSLSGEGEPVQLDAAAVSPGFFELLRVQPALGRTFAPGEEVRGQHRVAILSHGLWLRRFGGDPSIVGRTITLNDSAWKVIGVLPADFRFIESSIQIWSPLVVSGDSAPPSRTAHLLGVYARLKPGVSIEQARDSMERLGRRLAEQYPDANHGHGAHAVLMQDEFVRPVRTSLVVLFAAVGFVLLIACLNVASLLLARAASRRHEMAMRAALGASRGRLVVQTLVEGLALALAGGVVGLAVAQVTIAALPAIMPAHLSIVALSSVTLDARVLLFALAVSVLTGVIFSIVPALQASKPRVVDALTAGGRSPAGVRRNARLALVIGEVAMATLTLTGAGLATRSFVAILSQPLGFDSAHRVALSVWLPQAKYPTPQLQRQTLADLEQRLGAIPGVRAIGGVDILPLSGGDSRRGISIEGRPDNADTPARMHLRSVTPGYFRAMDIPIVEGRGFTPQDDERALPAAVITSAAARRFWPGESPIGKRFSFNAIDGWWTIVGVAGDVRHWGLSRPVNPLAYLPQAQHVADGLAFVLDSGVETAAIVTAGRAEIAAVDPRLPLGDVDTMDALVSRSLEPQRAQMLLMGAFAALALLLAAVGIYGVMAQLAAMRVHEIGVRLSLGARPIDILRQSLLDGLAQAATGLVIGLSAGAYLMRFAQSMLYDVKPWDIVTLASVSGVLVGAALLATSIPARRAMRVDPVVALRMQ